MARLDTRNRSKYWNYDDIPGLSLLLADFTTHEYAPHAHEAFVIAVTEYGGAEFKSRGTVDRAHRSALLVFNPGEPHSGNMGGSERWQYRSMYLTDRAIRSVCDGLGLASVPYFTRNSFSDRDLVRAFTALHRQLEADEGQLARDASLYESFSGLFQRHAAPITKPEDAPQDKAVVQLVIEFMLEHYGDDLALDDLARLCGLTPFQLIRCFNKTVGLPPHAYLTQIRLKMACRLLREGVPMADVALAVGFYDQSALNKHFKRSYGMTPRQYVAAVTH
jgi:AraC-like DNA-binding protein